MHKEIVVVKSDEIKDMAASGLAYLQEKITKVFSFLAVSSLFIGGTGFFKTLLGYAFLGMAPNMVMCSAVFLTSFGVYSLDKIADLDKDTTNMPERRGFLHGRKKLVTFYSLAAYVMSIALIFLDKPIAVILVLVPVIANVIYGTKLIPGLPRLKDIPVMKNMIVAFSWALITIMLPALHLENALSQNVTIIFYFMMVKTFIDTVLYDVRDVKGDKESGVKTIPVLLGTKKTTAILLLANSTLIPCIAFAAPALRLLTAMLVVYGYAYILYFRERRNPLALDFCVEGEWMLATIALVALYGVSILA